MLQACNMVEQSSFTKLHKKDSGVAGTMNSAPKPSKIRRLHVSFTSFPAIGPPLHVLMSFQTRGRSSRERERVRAPKKKERRPPARGELKRREPHASLHSPQSRFAAASCHEPAK